MIFFSFFRFYVLVNNKITVIARKLISFRKYRYFNSRSNAIHPIQVHKAVLEKLRFDKKEKKILTSNISEIDESILCPKNCLDWCTKSTATKNFKAIKTILLYLCNDKKKSPFL